MKENKSVRIEIRLTPREKELIKEYACAHDISVSELVRMALLSKINKGE